MARRVVRVRVGTDDADLAADTLWSHGAEAVSESVEGDVVYLVAGYPSEAGAAAAHAAVNGRWQARWEAADDDAWVTTWREGEPAHDVGPFHLRLPEHPPSADRLDLAIEPGATFGFSHTSTLLALEAIGGIEMRGCSAADVGCGSGVLAIACALLGAAPVEAVDIDPAAVARARANVASHGLADVIEVRRGSVDTLTGPADVVCANLLAATLVELGPLLAAAIRPGGTAVLSGLLTGDVSRVAAEFGPNRRLATLADGDWAAMVVR